MTVVLHEAALRELLRSPVGPVGRYVERKAAEVETLARQFCGFDVQHDFNRYPQHLRDTIHSRAVSVRGEAAREVGSEQDYALAHHEGTAAHVISPRRSKRLVFRSRTGRLVILRVGQSVNHPGTRANPYLKNALDRVMSA